MAGLADYEGGKERERKEDRDGGEMSERGREK